MTLIGHEGKTGTLWTASRDHDQTARGPHVRSQEISSVECTDSSRAAPPQEQVCCRSAILTGKRSATLSLRGSVALSPGMVRWWFPRRPERVALLGVAGGRWDSHTLLPSRLLDGRSRARACTEPRCLIGCWVGRKHLLAVADDEGAIELLGDFHLAAGEVPALSRGTQLEAVLLEADDIVGSHLALVLEAEDALGGEILRPGPIGGDWIISRHGELGIEAREIGVEDRVRLLDGCGSRQAQLGDEAILAGAKEPLDPALRLGTLRCNRANRQLGQHPFHLSGFIADAALPVGTTAFEIDHPEDAMAVMVDGQGNADGQADLLQQRQVAGGILPLPEERCGDRARRIIDTGDEDQARSPLLQPRMVTAVDL